ncbi:hypothetical protein KY290_024867 [Solanum tuberosum]|uniref:Reverse transcriptase RNase H-like domain-containing protein n=1 Tax=Solanum tuberosum TaxID=4113 RepID=A0ABQ7UTX1_SOLTU|nr:hypothetical protein KY284_023725 [Solanum tuberosum]KAH0754597.1 hypothetical protein KY290_024867 [Solanum tuberosum]
MFIWPDESTIDYLGHVISKKDLVVDTGKIIAIQQLPEPNWVKDVRYTGLNSSEFYSRVSGETDASGQSIWDVLSQQGHPIAYFSQKLSFRMQRASTYHPEMVAITQAVSKRRQYLLG